MPDFGPANEDAPREARAVRRLRIQVAFGAALASLIVLHRYVPMGDYRPWIEHAQLWIATLLAFDVLVRPALRRLLPTEVTIRFGHGQK